MPENMFVLCRYNANEGHQCGRGAALDGEQQNLAKQST